MSGISTHLKDNTFVYNILSSIDNKVFSAYNIRYCTYKKNEVFLIVVSNSEDKNIDKYWSGIKSQCSEKGVLLEYIITSDKEYNKEVRGKFPHKLLESGYLSINGR